MNQPMIQIIELNDALHMLNDPDFRVKDMRMAQDFHTWQVYWEFITPDNKWYRVVAGSHGDKNAIELYRGCWNFGVRNRPHLYGLFDKQESVNGKPAQAN